MGADHRIQGLGGRIGELARLPREIALARLGYGLKQPVFALPFYRFSLSGQTATALRMGVSDPWPGDPQMGSDIIQGRFHLAGRTILDPLPLWEPREADAAWRSELHGFLWLRHLRAAGGDAGRRRARELTADWLERYPAWDALAWNPLSTGWRLANWLGCHAFFAASAEVEFRHRLLGAITRQARHLMRVLPAGLVGADLIAALKGQIYAGVCLPGGEAWLLRGLALLERELRRQILPDGGHVERSPSRQLTVLRDLIDLRALLRAGGAGSSEITRRAAKKAIDALQETIEAMAPLLRAYRHGDGALALFNGSAEEETWRIEMVLQRAGGRPRPVTSAVQSGFERLSAGRSLILVDAGAPPRSGLDGHAHAGTLSFEMSVGSERLIVNCGAQPGSRLWVDAQRATAAHSTLVLGETNSATLRPGARGLARRPLEVICERAEQDGRIWLTMVHDGYRQNFGILHHRRLYLTADGSELRGEDRLEPLAGVQRGLDFAVRFHLHPEVTATLAQGGAALLRLPKGGAWRFSVSGAEAALEESVYLGSARPRRSHQIVLRGDRSGADLEETTVRWALLQI